jgi:hypothetical protein
MNALTLTMFPLQRICQRRPLLGTGFPCVQCNGRRRPDRQPARGGCVLALKSAGQAGVKTLNDISLQLIVGFNEELTGPRRMRICFASGEGSKILALSCKANNTTALFLSSGNAAWVAIFDRCDDGCDRFAHTLTVGPRHAPLDTPRRMQGHT